MHYIKTVIVFFIALLVFADSVKAQVTDSTTDNYDVRDFAHQKLSWRLPLQKRPFNTKQYLIPGLMIAYGFSAIESDRLQRLNGELKEEVYDEKPHKKSKLDNYLQFAPAVMVYGLDAAGIKAKHNLKDRTMLFLMSNIITTASVFSIKKLSKQMRPDGSGSTSFPSGHTAEAFANAEFLRQEYKDFSPWYGVAGYVIAATTGYLRMYNNKHWMSDVIAGAGVGIVSTKLAYWLYPKIKHKLFKDKTINTMIMPTYQNGSIGLGMVHRF